MVNNGISKTCLQLKRSSILQIFFPLIVIFSFSSCNNNQIKVSGSIDQYVNDTVFLEKLLPKIVDKKDLEQKYTAVTNSDGEFEFSFETDETAFYNLKLKNKQTVVLLLSHKDEIHLTGHKDSLSSSYTVEGSEDCNLVQELTQHQLKLGKLVGDYQNISKNLLAIMQTAPSKAAKDSLFKVKVIEEKKLRDKYHEHKQYMRGFIEAHSASMASLLAAKGLDQNEDFEYLKKLDSTLSLRYPTSSYLTDFHKTVEDLKVFAIGAIPPDITSTDKQGKSLSLSAIKGKVVLIYFWASLSTASRLENRTLANLYKNYQDDGLEIFSVSFDAKREDWLTAIQKDSLNWPYHVSDLKGLNSRIAKEYKLKNIPYTMLIGADGRIIAKGLKGIDLENKIKEALKIENTVLNPSSIY